MNNSKNKKMIFLLSTIVGLFLLISIYLVYFNLFKADDLNNHPLNARNTVDESIYARGSILDRNGETLTYSELNGEKYTRINNYNYLYSTIIGYSSDKYGKSGLELSQNTELLDVVPTDDIISKLEDIYQNDNIGKDIKLTIDDRIQSRAYQLLEGYKGSVIVSKPNTGEILAMVSRPSFNVNQIDTNWDEIINSNDAIMINRATQGLYEPGSIFKIVTGMAMLENNIDLNYYDTGEATIADHTVNNYNSRVYGEMDLEKALNVSANTYFFEKSQEISNSMFLDILHKMGIGKNFNLGININKSQIPFKSGLSNLEKGNASFGQGVMYVTPLDMMLMINSIANDGKVMTPFIIDSIIDKNIETKTEPSTLANGLSSENVEMMKTYLKSTAENFGIFLSNGNSIGGKTGTAETGTGASHSWYVSMSPVESPEYTIVVQLENAGDNTTGTAVPIAIDLYNFISTLEN